MLAVFALSGGHWAALQTVANARMLYDRAQSSASLATAVAETFDGDHPCELCRAIAAAKSREHKDQSGLPNVKQDAKAKAVLAASTLRVPDGLAAGITLAFHATPLESAPPEAPPVPPPRGARSTA